MRRMQGTASYVTTSSLKHGIALLFLISKTLFIIFSTIDLIIGFLE